MEVALVMIGLHIAYVRFVVCVYVWAEIGQLVNCWHSLGSKSGFVHVCPKKEFLPCCEANRLFVHGMAYHL